MARKPPKDANEIKKDLILEQWGDESTKNPVELSELPFDVVLTVFSMMCKGADKAGDSIAPPENYYSDLLPNTEKTSALISKAFKAKAIIVDINKCKVPDFTDDGLSMYTLKVHYKPNISWGDTPLDTLRNTSKARELLHELFMKKCWFEKWTEEFLDIWQNIALAECLEYADNRADYYNFYRNEINLDELCKSLLQSYSVSNIHSLISTAFHNAAAFQKTDKCTSHRHALNTIPSKISSLASRPANQVKEWDRINELPRCEFSITLFNKMLGYSEDIGFYKCPSKHYFAIAEERLKHFVDTRDNFNEEEKENNFRLLQFVLNKPDFSELDLAALIGKGFRLVGEVLLDEETGTYTATATYDDYYHFDEALFLGRIAAYFGYQSELEPMRNMTRSEFIAAVTVLINKGRKCPKNIKEAMLSLLNEPVVEWESIFKFIRSADNKSNIIGMLDSSGISTEFECSSSSQLYANNYSLRLPFNLYWATSSNLNKLCVAANKNMDAFAQEYASNLLENIKDMELASKVADYLVQGISNPKPKIEIR
jgi:hypothetical protein